MKLDSDNYKIVIYTEDICPDCIDLKEKLKESNIPFINKSITHTIDITSNLDFDKEKANNRWEFIDLSNDYPIKVAFSPVIVVENSEGEIDDIFSLGEHEGGFENTDGALKILQENYCI